MPRPFDGRELGPDFARVRPPMSHMMVLGGMSVSKDDIAPLLRPLASRAALRHVLTLLARHARDRLRHPRGTRLVMGNALIARLLLSLRQRGVDPLMGVTVRELHQENTRLHAAGARARGDRGTRREPRSPRASPRAIQTWLTER